jgi:hypothetical protein
MLMGAVDRAVETMPFVIAVGLESLKEPRPLAELRPTVESIEYRLPRAKLLRQVAPRNARPTPPQHRLDEVAIIFRRSACTSLAQQHRLDLRPVPLFQLRPHHHASWNTQSTRWK